MIWPYLKSCLFWHYFEIFGCLVRFWVVFSFTKWHSESLLLFLFHGTEFRFVFSSAENSSDWTSESFICSTERNSEFLLFCGRVRNGIPRDCFKFCFLERNSELFFLPRKGSKQNSESILFHWTSWNAIGNNPLFRIFRFPRNFVVVGNSQPYSLADTYQLHCTLTFHMFSQPRDSILF